MKDEHMAYKRSMAHFAVVIMAALCGLALDWPVNSLEPYKCFGFAFTIGIFLPLIVFWIRDLIPEWHFRVAIKKALDNAFEIVPVGKGLAKRLVVVTKQM